MASYAYLQQRHGARRFIFDFASFIEIFWCRHISCIFVFASLSTISLRSFRHRSSLIGREILYVYAARYSCDEHLRNTRRRHTLMILCRLLAGDLRSRGQYKCFTSIINLREAHRHSLSHEIIIILDIRA